jgi:hypothetical protein
MSVPMTDVKSLGVKSPFPTMQKYVNDGKST